MASTSIFAQRFTGASGISTLMDDLGEAINANDPDACMLGGGNPAAIPEALAHFSEAMRAMIANDQLDQTIGNYSSPQGNALFIDTLVTFLNEHYQWDLTTKNIALTNGSQNSFFYLFNVLAGEMTDGSHKKILFPLSPEYIGYRDLGLSDNMFCSVKPTIQLLDKQQFKYHIDFDSLVIDDSVAAICVSRPTNPTGNVISDEELHKLDDLAQAHNIPLIVDNAYGLPFPGALYTDASIHWHNNIILGMSLSKLGLPGVRTGIVIAEEKTITAISKINGIMCLAPNNIGAGLATELLQTNKIVSLRDKVIRPFYHHKMQTALNIALDIFSGASARIHKPEGAFFLWLWLPDLTITSKALYQRLKERKVYIIPGEDFFMGIDENWEHQYQCIRINYAVKEEVLRKGLAIIAEEVKSAS